MVRGGPNCLTAAWSSSKPVLPEPLAARALLNLMLLLLEAEAKSALEAAWRRDALIDKQKADRERSRLLVLVLSGSAARDGATAMWPKESRRQSAATMESGHLRRRRAGSRSSSSASVSRA